MFGLIEIRLEFLVFGVVWLGMGNDTSFAVLKFGVGDDRWTAPPDQVWRSLLEVYLFEIADSFGLRGIQSVEGLRRDTVFNFGGIYDVEMLRTRKYSPCTVPLKCDPKTYTEDIALFKLNASSKRTLAFPSYGRWVRDIDNVGQLDEINFFSGASHLAQTDESAVIFYDLNKDYYNLLCAADPSIAKNLWTDFKMTSVFKPQD